MGALLCSTPACETCLPASPSPSAVHLWSCSCFPLILLFFGALRFRCSFESCLERPVAKHSTGRRQQVGQTLSGWVLLGGPSMLHQQHCVYCLWLESCSHSICCPRKRYNLGRPVGRTAKTAPGGQDGCCWGCNWCSWHNY